MPRVVAVQGRAELEDLAGAVRNALDTVEADPPLLLKIAPDLEAADLEDIAAVALERFQGVIVSNTTLWRPEGLRGAARKEPGGLSGRPLFQRSTAMLARLYRLTEGRLPLIGLGGIEDAETAWAKIAAGASLLQLYTAFAYKGPPLIEEILSGLEERLEQSGFETLGDAVGSDAEELSGR